MTNPDPPRGEQLALVRAAMRPPGGRRELPSTTDLAAVDPVAVVLVDVPLAHLDRPFEYAVPAALADIAQPGTRVKVRFAGQDVNGFILERRPEAEHEGRLAPLRRIVSPEPVLTANVLALCREVAARYAGTTGDVLRLAIPPRHAAAEKNLPAEVETDAAEQPLPEEAGLAWARYPAGASFLRRVSNGEAPAASWLATPAPDPAQDWPMGLAAAAAAARAGGRGALVVVPDHRDVDRVDAALRALLGKDQHVRLTSDQGPQARYTAWLKVLRGHVQVVIGTRAAMFAPVKDLGLVAWWDDGDDLLREPRAPYPQVREVLSIRARLEGAALLVGGLSRTTDVQQWVGSGVVRSVSIASGLLRPAVPRVVVAGEGVELERDPAAASAHLPSIAWRAAMRGLEHGPVLIQVPRRGYLPSLSCQACRQPARCARCHGPLGQSGPTAPTACRWCGTVVERWECPHCEGRVLRSSVVGARRTAEELGRAFPGVPVHTSGAGEVLASVPATPSLVIATPGAEPVAAGGYAATVLLDAWAVLDRPRLDTGEEALRRWLAAAALTRGSEREGMVVLCGVPTHTTLPVVEALVRWDPAWFAERELAERRELALPPTVRMAQVVGPRLALQRALDEAELGDEVERLGPMPAPVPRDRRGATGNGVSPARASGAADAGPLLQMLLRTDLAHGPALASALKDMLAIRSAHKEREPVSVRIDPADGLG